MRTNVRMIFALLAIFGAQAPVLADEPTENQASITTQTYEDDLNRLIEDLDMAKKKYQEVIATINFVHIWDLKESSFEREVSQADLKVIAEHLEDFKVFSKNCNDEYLKRISESYATVAEAWGIVNDPNRLASFDKYYAILDFFTECRRNLFSTHTVDAKSLYDVFADYVSNVYRLQTLLDAVKLGKQDMSQYLSDIEHIKRTGSLFSIYSEYKDADDTQRSEIIMNLNKVFGSNIRFSL